MHVLIAILALASTSVAVLDEPPDQPSVPPLRDYVAEWAAEIEAIPEIDRAWPLYEEASRSYTRLKEVLSSEIPSESVFPSHEHWPTLLSWLESNRDELALVKVAARRSAVGLPLSFHPDSQAEAILNDGRGPLLIDVTLPHLGLFRDWSRMLRVEMILAADSGDFELWRQDLEAMLGMARQVLREHMVLSNRVGCAIATYAGNQIAWLLASHPQLFDAAQLETVATIVESFAACSMVRPQLSGEHAATNDLFQRVFEPRDTGRLTPEGVKYIAWLAWTVRPDEPLDEPARTGKQRPDRETVYLALNALVACRRDIELMNDQILAAMDRAWARPLWQADFKELATLASEIADAPFRFKPVEVLMIDHREPYWAQESARLALDGCRLTVALARHRLKHGVYPQSLDALVPEFLAEMPIDRYSGKPFLYKLTDGKPLLYAAGVDQDDDGGEPMTSKNSPFPDDGWQDLPPAERPSGDWVIWPPRR